MIFFDFDLIVNIFSIINGTIIISEKSYTILNKLKTSRTFLVYKRFTIKKIRKIKRKCWK